jgi:hypothetical protein
VSYPTNIKQITTIKVSGFGCQAPGYWLLASCFWLLAAGSSLLVKIILPEASDQWPDTI